MRRREPIGPLDYTRRAWVRLTLLGTFVFLYAPILTLMA
ncbi:MAG: spermidine/putrescine ABC transporter permease PotC, partial [Gammaproteobacteria bacterium]|nr:spermidine/putrescine ABC transporter permease PotC [Gammaproteobacteria bacterium]